jgi:hypothetical protein
VVSTANSATANDTGERLAAYLAPQIVAEDLPGLFPLLSARPLISTFSALFHGSEAAVQIRLLVLREIGQRTDAPRWSRREIDAHFAYLDPTKLDTIVKRLADFDLLLWDADDRTYRVSAQGHGALAALAALMQFAEVDEARLTELEDDFAAAVRSASELQLNAAQARLESVFLWMEKGTEVIRNMTADNALDAAGWRIAQTIGQKQSRLMRMTGVFGRELAAMARQRVHLSRGGLSTTELATWLRRRNVNGLAALVEGCLVCTPEPIFVTPDVMLDVAEAELLREKVGAGGTALDVPQC